MKKGIAFVLALLVCLCACCALADDYGKAVVDAPSGQLHLREAASSSSASLGVYLTGTSVTLKSDPNAVWVEVKIGRERGYMKREYLKIGSEANSVEPEFWLGEVNANKYARMRKGPSTEYEFIRNVNNGENVTIMGETDEEWYYVKYKDEKGFISANLIYTRGSFSNAVDDKDEDDELGEGWYPSYQPVIRPVATPIVTPVVTARPVFTWRDAYLNYIVQYADDQDAFSIIYVNNDSVPELVIDSGVEAEGCRILTYANGQVNVLNTRRRGFTYIQRENKLCNSDGVMDRYYDDVYEIRDGRWVCIARGEYYGYLSGWSEILQRYICQNYYWNGRKTTIEQYLIALSAVYDRQSALGVEEGYSYRAMQIFLGGGR